MGINKLAVFDVSDPDNLEFTSYQNEAFTQWCPSVYVSNKYVFVLGTWFDIITIFDISTPEKSVPVASYRDPDYLEYPASVSVSKNYIYVVGKDSNNLAIFEFTETE